MDGVKKKKKPSKWNLTARQYQILLWLKGEPSIYFFLFRCTTFVKRLQMGGNRKKWQTSVSSLPFSLCVCLSSVEKYNDPCSTWARFFPGWNRWGWVTGAKRKMLVALGCPICPPCHFWSKENIELGEKRTMNPDVQPVERWVMRKQSWPLSAKLGNGRGL